MNAIYLDNNATTPLAPAALAAMRPHLSAHPGNPASSHRFGRQARRAVEDAREQIARLLDADPDEILFTSAATEANNLAIFGLTGNPGPILASPIEHPSVFEPIRELTKRGFALQVLPVRMDGIVETGRQTREGEAPAEPETPELHPLRGSAGGVVGNPVFAAVMLANHETGAVQPVETLARHLADCPLHCDAAAAAGKMPISFRKLGAASLTISAHKFHGPQGIGALVVRKGARFTPIFFGGHQQQARRPGTEPVALIAGMAAALQWSLDNLPSHHARLLQLRQRLLDRLHREAEPVILNGPEIGGLPGTLNLSFPGCRADALLIALDLAGVACSTGSACSSGSLLPSPVLTAMGKTGAILDSAMRFSLSPLQSDAEIDDAAGRIVQCVRKLRDRRED